MQPYGGYMPKGDGPAAPATACSFSYEAPVAATEVKATPAKKLEPYGGYVPKGDRPAAPAPATTSSKVPAAAPVQMMSAPAKKWQVYRISLSVFRFRMQVCMLDSAVCRLLTCSA